MRARGKALGGPAAGFVEAARVCEQAVHGGVEVDRLFGDLFTEGGEVLPGELRDLGAHELRLSRRSWRSWRCAGAANHG
jgi:hypothetical protein